MVASSNVSRLDAILAAAARGSLLVAGISLVAMTGVEFWQVFARYVLNDSPSWTEPVALLLMKFAMMFGAAAGVRTESHFGFYILVQAVRPAAGRALVAFARLVILGIGLVIALWGTELMIDGWSVPMAGAALPEGINYLPVAAGGLLIAVFATGHMLGPTQRMDHG